MFKASKTEDSFWPSISDLMSGLMLVFLLIAIAYMLNSESDRKSSENLNRRVQGILKAYHEKQDDLYNALYNEFAEDFETWNAILNRETLSVKFKSPDVLFESNSCLLKEDFKKILNSFFPRYLNIIFSPNFSDCIEEIRIEGHTSSEWNTSVSSYVAYFKNMELSQCRTRAVLEYCFYITNSTIKKDKMMKTITANGLSSSRLEMKSGEEDKTASRRVEFRIKTDAEKEIQKIIDQMKGMTTSLITGM